MKVPANKEKSPVTAILYDTPKFYPDNETVDDFTSVLREQFTNPDRSKKVQISLSNLFLIQFFIGTSNLEFI